METKGCEKMQGWLKRAQWPAKTTLGTNRIARLQIRPTMKLNETKNEGFLPHLVKINLPNLVDCKRYTAPL